MALLESLTLPLGTPAPEFTLQDATGKSYSLTDYKDKKAVVIIFMCNHCPYVIAVWDRIVALENKYRDRDIQFISINPNIHPDYPEDAIEKMPEYAAKHNMTHPYLADPTQEVAKEYQAQCTPDIYVFDNELKLAYHGRIDDNWKEPETATSHELDEALEALSQNQKPKAQQHPSMGCSIKWK